MIKRLKEFDEWHALGVGLVLVVMIMSFFDYLLFIMEKGRGDTSSEMDVPVVQTASEDGGAGTEAIAGPLVILDGSQVQIVADPERRHFEIWNGEIKAGDIAKESPSQVDIFKRIGNHVYLGVAGEAAVDSALFSGPKEIYRLDLEGNTLTNIFSRDCLVQDISADEKRLLAVERFYVGEEVQVYLNVHDLAGGEDLSFAVLPGYVAAGNAIFSSDGKKVVYEAAAKGARDLPDQKFISVVIDLISGEQRQIAEGWQGRGYVADGVLAAYDAKYGVASAAMPNLEGEFSRGLTYAFSRSEIRLGFEAKGFQTDVTDPTRFYSEDNYPASIASELGSNRPEDYCAAASAKEGMLTCSATGGGVAVNQMACFDSPTGGGMSCRYLRYFLAPTGVENYPYLVASLDLGDIARTKCGNEDYDQLVEREKCYVRNFDLRAHADRIADFDRFIAALQVIK